MPVSAIDLADALVTSLNAAVFVGTYTDITAKRDSYHPEYSLEDLAALQVDVVPAASALQMSSRTTNQKDVQLSIGVQRRVSTKAASDDLVKLVEQIATHCLRRSLLASTYHCVEVVIDPLFSSENMREGRVFTSVLTCTFRGQDA